MMVWHKVIFGGFILIGGLLLFRSFIVINTTRSLPLGIYYKTFSKPQRGDIVLVSPPDLPIFQDARKKKILSYGQSEAGTCPLIKILIADAGDEIQEEGMTVNGKVLANSKRKAWSIEGMVTLPIKKKLEDEVLLYTPHPLSFDSRYFGTLRRATILSTLKPLFLWR